MTKWDYMWREEQIHIDMGIYQDKGESEPGKQTEWLDEVGTEGWELISIIPDPHPVYRDRPLYRLFFKRPRQD